MQEITKDAWAIQTLQVSFMKYINDTLCIAQMGLPFSWVKCTVTSRAFPNNREGKGGRETERQRQRYKDTETEKPRDREA